MFDTVSGTAREALAQLRRALGVLRSDEAARAPRAGPGHPGALIAAGHATPGSTVAFEQDGQARPVPPDLAATAYRIVQESLTNIVKHAAARNVRVG